MLHCHRDKEVVEQDRYSSWTRPFPILSLHLPSEHKYQNQQKITRKFLSTPYPPAFTSLSSLTAFKISFAFHLVIPAQSSHDISCTCMIFLISAKIPHFGMLFWFTFTIYLLRRLSMILSRLFQCTVQYSSPRQDWPMPRFGFFYCTRPV